MLLFVPTATSFGLKSLKGSKVSLRRADLRRLARGSLMESSDPVRRDRFGRSEWPCDGGAASGENMVVDTAGLCQPCNFRKPSKNGFDT